MAWESAEPRGRFSLAFRWKRSYSAGMNSGKAEASSAPRPLLPLWARTLLLVIGLSAVVWLVRSVGVRAVLDTLVAAGPWLPVIFLLELSWVGVEGLGLLVLLGPERKIPLRDWAVAALTHFSTMMVLPVGRAGAEVARATLLSRHVGGPRALASASLMQALVLLAGAFFSLVCAGFVVASGRSPELSALLFGNAFVTAFLGAGLYLVMSRVRSGRRLFARFEKTAHYGPEVAAHVAESRPRHFLAFGLVLAGRLVQTLQYGVLLAAVAGRFDVLGTFLAQGIHLVGASLGDMVPNQVGVNEGAFRLFAGAIGLGDHPERAVSLALLARLSTLTAAGSCALVLQLLPTGRSRNTAPTPVRAP